MVLSDMHTLTHFYHPFGLTGLLSPPAATAPVCLHLPFLCNPQKEGELKRAGSIRLYVLASLSLSDAHGCMLSPADCALEHT